MDEDKRITRSASKKEEEKDPSDLSSTVRQLQEGQDGLVTTVGQIKDFMGFMRERYEELSTTVERRHEEERAREQQREEERAREWQREEEQARERRREEEQDREQRREEEQARERQREEERTLARESWEEHLAEVVLEMDRKMEESLHTGKYPAFPGASTATTGYRRTEQPRVPAPPEAGLYGDRGPPFARPVQRAHVYDGKTSWEAYQVQFEVTAFMNGWNEIEKTCFLISSLTGPALGVLETLPPEARSDYTALTQALRDRFQDTRNPDQAKAILSARRRKKGESLPELAADIERLVRQAYPACNRDAVDDLASERFLQALPDLEARRQIRLLAPKTLAETVNTTLRIEAITQQEEAAQRTPQTQRLRAMGGQKNADEGHDTLMARLQQQVEELMKWKRDHESQRESQRGPRCFHCNQTGHLARQCRQRPATLTRYGQREGAASNQGN